MSTIKMCKYSKLKTDLASGLWDRVPGTESQILFLVGVFHRQPKSLLKKKNNERVDYYLK